MSLYDLTPVIGLVATHTITVKRPNATTYGAGGFANVQTFTTYTAEKCSVQPGNGKGLDKAPEGTRASDVVRVWGAFAFQPGDRLTIPGMGDFEVFNQDDWNASGSYTRVFARALAASEPRP